MATMVICHRPGSKNILPYPKCKSWSCNRQEQCLFEFLFTWQKQKAPSLQLVIVEISVVKTF